MAEILPVLLFPEKMPGTCAGSRRDFAGILFLTEGWRGLIFGMGSCIMVMKTLSSKRMIQTRPGAGGPDPTEAPAERSDHGKESRS